MAAAGNLADWEMNRSSSSAPRAPGTFRHRARWLETRMALTEPPRRSRMDASSWGNYLRILGRAHIRGYYGPSRSREFDARAPALGSCSGPYGAQPIWSQRTARPRRMVPPRGCKQKLFRGRTGLFLKTFQPRSGFRPGSRALSRRPLLLVIAPYTRADCVVSGNRAG
jgi:hypothetical protein